MAPGSIFYSVESAHHVLLFVLIYCYKHTYLSNQETPCSERIHRGASAAHGMLNRFLVELYCRLCYACIWTLALFWIPQVPFTLTASMILYLSTPSLNFSLSNLIVLFSISYSCSPGHEQNQSRSSPICQNRTSWLSSDEAAWRTI